MSSSKRLSDKKELFTLSDLNDWVAEAYRIGMPPEAIVRANVTWRGRVREIWVSDAEVVPGDVAAARLRVSSDAAYDRPKFAGIMNEDPGLSEKAKDFRRNEGEKGTYIPQQQVTPGGPIHGGFTVFEPKDKK